MKNLLLVPELRDDLTFSLGTFSAQSLSYVDENDLLTEVRNFSNFLVEMDRISLSEQGQTEHGFLDFLFTYRREAGPAGTTANFSATDLLRCCTTRGSQRLLHSVFCLGGNVQSSSTTPCDGIGHLSTDVTSGVCAVILSYLVAHRVRRYGSVTGPKLNETMETHRRLVDLSELSEDTLWDDIGIVTG